MRVRQETHFQEHFRHRSSVGVEESWADGKKCRGMVTGVQMQADPEDWAVLLCPDENLLVMKRSDSAAKANQEAWTWMSSLARRLQFCASGLEMGYSFGDSVGIHHLSSSQTERSL